ncbi:MAG TPA: hypothetical protein VMU03_15635, partial [Gammaproteobacteria bacterium]|nr:hypothetical protein [Gammaproteobacteria bacterium]
MRPIPQTLAIVLGCVGAAGCHSSGHDQQPTPTGGLDSRPSNVGCVAPSKTTGGGTTVATQHVFPGLTFNQPLLMLQAPGDASRWYVLERGGSVRVFANTPNVSTASTALTLAVDTTGEGGLLGMAFHPSYATNHQ